MWLALLLWACGEPVDDFATLEADILVPSCAFSGCHGGDAGGLTLDDGVSYDALVGVESAAVPGEIRVVPGDSESSYLIKKLDGTGDIVGDVMPPDSPMDQELVDPHSWGILPVSTALDFLSSHGVERSPPVFRVVAHDDVPFGFTVPRRGNLDDTSSYDVITLPTGFSISRMERLAGIALDVSLSQHDGLIPSPGHPMRIELESAVDVEVVGLGFTPGIVAGLNIGSYQIQSMAVTVQPAVT